MIRVREKGRAVHNFIEKYDLSNIYSIDIVECCKAGYNSVLLAPKDLAFAKKYKRIIFRTKKCV